MAIRKIEPDETDKMQGGYEYLKIIIGDETSTLIYYDAQSQREEIIEGRFNLMSVRKDDWQHVYSNLEHYFERITPEGKALKAEAEEKAKQALVVPDDLKHYANPHQSHKFKPHIDYAHVEWSRDKKQAHITYYNVEKSRNEKRSASTYGDVEKSLIRQGYYVLGSAGGREGVVGNFVKYRKLPKTLEP